LIWGGVGEGEGEGSDAMFFLSPPPPPPPLGYIHSSAMTHNHSSDFPSRDTRRHRYKRCVNTGMVAERAKGGGSSRACNEDDILVSRWSLLYIYLSGPTIRDRLS